MVNAVGPCPLCRGHLGEDRWGEVPLLVCRNCGGVVLSADSLAQGPTTIQPPGRATPAEPGYPNQFPQQDHGYTAAQPIPWFGPRWGQGPTNPTPDGQGLLRD